MENLSLLQRDGKMAFSPVYDPTPMWAYARHNELPPQEMTFGDFGDVVGKKDSPVTFSMAIEHFCKTHKINKKTWMGIVDDSLHVTADYPGRVGQLKRLPDEGKDRLITIHKDITLYIKFAVYYSMWY